jgi:hypothetical protein
MFLTITGLFRATRSANRDCFFRSYNQPQSLLFANFVEDFDQRGVKLTEGIPR